jgi:hypothetical protein
MGVVYRLIFQPLISVLGVIIAISENVLGTVCSMTTSIADLLTNIFEWVSDDMVPYVCKHVSDFICTLYGICDAKHRCRHVSDYISDLVINGARGLMYTLRWITQQSVILICNYIIQYILIVLNYIDAIVSISLIWVGISIDTGIQAILCWTHIAEFYNNRRPRYFKITPKIVPNDQGHSDWFIYVSNDIGTTVATNSVPTVAGPTTIIIPKGNTTIAAGSTTDQITTESVTNPDGTTEQLPSFTSSAVDRDNKYILSDKGKPLRPHIIDGICTYYEVAVDTTSGNITGSFAFHIDPITLVRSRIQGFPLLYYPYKIIEIADHMFSNIFGTNGLEVGSATYTHNPPFTPAPTGYSDPYTLNLLTYKPRTQAQLGTGFASSLTAGQFADQLTHNVYANWTDKFSGGFTTAAAGTVSGYQEDIGTRVSRDGCCNHRTNTSFNLTTDISYTPPSTSCAEKLGCGSGLALTFDQTNFLVSNKDNDDTVITTYFVNKYQTDEASLGCSDLLGYTINRFSDVVGDLGGGTQTNLFVSLTPNIFVYSPNKNIMMATVVNDIINNGTLAMIGIAENFIHGIAHQCGLLTQTDKPVCNNPTLNVSKIMNPHELIRRVFSRMEWCMIWNSDYVTEHKPIGGGVFNDNPIAPEIDEPAPTSVPSSSITTTTTTSITTVTVTPDNVPPEQSAALSTTQITDINGVPTGAVIVTTANDITTTTTSTVINSTTVVVPSMDIVTPPAVIVQSHPAPIAATNTNSKNYNELAIETDAITQDPDFIAKVAEAGAAAAAADAATNAALAIANIDKGITSTTDVPVGTITTTTTGAPPVPPTIVTSPPDVPPIITTTTLTTAPPPNTGTGTGTSIITAPPPDITAVTNPDPGTSSATTNF